MSRWDEADVSELLPVVYDELRRVARGYLQRERRPQTLQATALVNETYLKLAKREHQRWQGRTHFVAVAAIAMRQILVERARARTAQKRGGSQDPITLNEAVVAEVAKPSQLVALDAALTRLAASAPERARIVELRFFGGLTIEETADALGLSPATVKRRWTLARAWLRREIAEGDGDGS